MATKPALKAVAPILTLLQLVEAMETLRLQISELIPDAKDVGIALGRDGLSFELTIELPPLADPARTIFMLERNIIDGIHLTKIRPTLIPGSMRRHQVLASIVAPQVPA